MKKQANNKPQRGEESKCPELLQYITKMSSFHQFSDM